MGPVTHNEDSSASLTATGAARSLPAGLRKPAVAAIEALGLSGAADRAPRLLELLKSPDAEARKVEGPMEGPVEKL